MAAKTSVDLEERFGKRFKIGRDEAYAAEYGERGTTHDPWLLTVECVNGHIFPWGGDHLAAATRGRGPTARALKALPCVEVIQDGDDGINAKFHVDDFAKVAEVMKPRRRRKLTPEQRAANLERLSAYRFQSGPDARRGGTKGQISVPTA